MESTPMRRLSAHEADSLQREAANLNRLARGGTNRFSEERDEIRATLRGQGYPTDFDA